MHLPTLHIYDEIKINNKTKHTLELHTYAYIYESQSSRANSSNQRVDDSAIPANLSFGTGQGHQAPHLHHRQSEIYKEHFWVFCVPLDNATNALVAAGEYLVGDKQALAGEKVEVILVVERGRSGIVQLGERRVEVGAGAGAELLEGGEEVDVGGASVRNVAGAQAGVQPRAEGGASGFSDGVSPCSQKSTRGFMINIDTILASNQ